MVIIAREMEFGKKVVKLTMKNDVLKTVFTSKKAHYGILNTLDKTFLVQTHLYINALVPKCPLLESTF